MNCPDCGNEMNYDGWGMTMEGEKHNWWICEKCDKMHIEVVKNPEVIV